MAYAEALCILYIWDDKVLDLLNISTQATSQGQMPERMGSLSAWGPQKRATITARHSENVLQMMVSLPSKC